MPLIATHKLTRAANGATALDGLVLPSRVAAQVYNGLDCCVTHEVHRELSTLFNEPPVVYDFERALQAPCLEMMQRGFKVDGYERDKSADAVRRAILLLEEILEEFARAVWDKLFKHNITKQIRALNPGSQKQLIAFFCDAMRLPPRWTSKKGERKQSMDREALEFYAERYLHARPLVACILDIREMKKVLQVLETEIDRDLRFRTSINIAGTDTGRFSTSTSVFGTGTNIQNLKRDDDVFKEEWKDLDALPEYIVSVRRMLVADRGFKLGGIDLEQAESRETGWQCGVLFGDWSYLDSCEQGDLHTTTARFIWPTLAWTGDAKKDRTVAEQMFYRHFTYRDMSKRGGHGSNYYGTPWTMAKHLKVPTRLMEEFQDKYFGAFPGIRKWHTWTAAQLQTTQVLSTPFGRVRHFFGRPRDDTTLRKAIAFVPQSSTADRMNLGLWRIWKHMHNRVQLLAQVHDALYFQFPEGDDEEAIMQDALALCSVPLRDPRTARVFTVPGEAKTGWNWGLFHTKFNPGGMRKLQGKDERRRIEGRDRIL